MSSQEAAANSYGEVVEVELVNVEVRVRDRKGMPVTGLTAADFEVFHDAQAVPISHFTEFRNGSPAPSADAQAVADSPAAAIASNHSLIVYFDELHLQATHRGALIEALQRFISSQRVPAEKIMILRQGRDLHVEAPFGTSERELNKVLSELQKSTPGLSYETALRQALDEIQRTWNQSRDATGSGERGVAQIPGSTIGGVGSASGSVGGGTSPRDVTGASPSLSGGIVPSSCDIFDSRVEAILDGWMRERSSLISVTLARLADCSAYLEGLPGSKSLLYLSDVLETRPGSALSNYADTICPGGQQNLFMNTLGEQLEGAFRALTRHAAANRVTFYSLQGGGLQVGSTGGARETGVRAGSIASFEASRRADDQSGLVMLAEETGGRAVLNQNDYREALQELSAEMLSFYSLAYRPPPADGGPQHRIEVRLQDRSLVARYRQGYTEKSVDQRFSESLQGALFLGLVDNPLQARLGAGDFRAAGEGVVVVPLRVVLPVARVSFTPRGDQLMAGVLVRILARNLESGRLRTRDKSFQVRHQPGSEGEWIQLPVEVELDPGAHQLAVGVLDQESGVRSLVSTTVELPAS